MQILFYFVYGSDCCCYYSVTKSFLTLCNQASLSFTISWSLPNFLSIELVMVSNHFILCCSLLLLPSIFPSIRVFSNESALCIRWPKYRNFSISPSNEYSGLRPQIIRVKNNSQMTILKAMINSVIPLWPNVAYHY